MDRAPSFQEKPFAKARSVEIRRNSARDPRAPFISPAFRTKLKSNSCCVATTSEGEHENPSSTWQEEV
jgi:hypothetical protein